MRLHRLDSQIVLVAIVAGVAGSVGTWTFHFLADGRGGRVEAVRATRFELTDRSGRVAAVLGFAENHSVALRFLDPAGRETLRVGVVLDSVPQLVMRQADGQVFLGFANASRPSLSLHDTSRVAEFGQLGVGDVVGPDDLKYAEWGARFSVRGGGVVPTDWAGLGLRLDRNDQTRGFVRIRDSETTWLMNR